MGSSRSRRDHDYINWPLGMHNDHYHHRSNYPIDRNCGLYRSRRVRSCHNDPYYSRPCHRSCDSWDYPSRRRACNYDEYPVRRREYDYVLDISVRPTSRYC